MKQTVDFYSFRSEFERMRPTNFSYAGLCALWDHFEQYEDDCGVEVELDVIAICCDYSEEHYTDIAENYEIELPDTTDEQEKIDAVVEYLNNHTYCVAETENGCIVYQAF